MKTMLRPAIITVLALAIAGTAFAGFGVGAHPLTQKAVSMWIVGDDGKAVLLVYFVGAPGWHDRRWQTQSEIGAGQSKATVHRLVSGDLTLEIAVSPDGRTFTVQKREFAAESSNVFVVRSADSDQSKQGVEPIGRFKMASERGKPVAVWAIEEYPEIRAAVEK